MKMTHSSICKDANKILGVLHEKLVHLSDVKFGRNMLDEFDTHAYWPKQATEGEFAFLTTLRHRFVNKFEEPQPGAEKLLRDLCNEKWVLYEESVLKPCRIYNRLPNGMLDTIYRSTWWNTLTPVDKKVLFKARETLHELFGDLKIDLHNADVEFTPGETNISLNGMTDVYSKLKNVANITVTPDALDDFVRLCYHHYGLKQCMKMHFKRGTRKDIEDVNFNYDYDGFKVFTFYMLRDVVTLVPGSVGDSVYKNSETRRFINKEPLGNMLLQRLPANAIRKVLSARFIQRLLKVDGSEKRKVLHELCNPLYNDLQTGQDRHKRLISCEGLSTIDWSNASDSIHMDAVHFLFPANLRKLLTRWRSPFVLVDEKWYMPEKLCSMGNGFCFEVLTLVLLSLARVVDPKSSVYGDDVIIADDAVDAFVSAAQKLGFTLNETKSFIRSNFRESCGAFYHKDIGYITTFDFHWCEILEDVVITTNKLFLIMEAHSWVKPYLEQSWKALIRLIPTSRLGPISAHSRENLSSLAMHPKWERIHRRDEEHRGLRSLLIEDTQLALEALHIDISHVYVVEQPKFVAKMLKKIRPSVKDPFVYAHVMYANRVSDIRFRPRPKDADKSKRRGEWVYPKYFVLPTGQLLSCSKLKEVHKSMLLSLILLSIGTNVPLDQLCKVAVSPLQSWRQHYRCRWSLCLKHYITKRNLM